MDIRIRKFERADQDDVAELINENLREHFGASADPSRNPDLLDIASSYGDDHFLVAIDATGRVVGTGALIRERRGTGRIVRMHTAPDCRRSGVAGRLLSALESQARERQWETMVLETNLDWDTAIAFYRAHGYREVERVAGEAHFAKPLTR